MKNTKYGFRLEKQVNRFELCHEDQIFRFWCCIGLDGDGQR